MRSFVWFLAFASSMLLAGCASQPENEAATGADQRVICRTDRELGSLQTRRVCKTASEWQTEREEQQEGMRSIDRQPMPAESPGSDNIGG